MKRSSLAAYASNLCGCFEAFWYERSGNSDQRCGAATGRDMLGRVSANQ